MTGPDHYREGERLLGLCDAWIDGAEDRAHLATEANAHFTAALVAVLAASQHPESVAWAKVIDP
ncbi:hypothetical protein [Streptomyces stelliscabiei]|uniref:hypothetical protein n=1 Tax=Streptomyces stelliscabiei TaxID=146820 RepID=UPI0029AD440C|nr:hypothetical protein [Streptomyces stelliscabiei]MDX2550104.1 hypothetical protein [Streptomyces stelliscabiei]